MKVQLECRGFYHQLIKGALLINTKPEATVSLSPLSSRFHLNSLNNNCWEFQMKWCLSWKLPSRPQHMHTRRYKRLNRGLVPFALLAVSCCQDKAVLIPPPFAPLSIARHKALIHTHSSLSLAVLYTQQHHQAWPWIVWRACGGRAEWMEWEDEWDKRRYEELKTRRCNRRKDGGRLVGTYLKVEDGSRDGDRGRQSGLVRWGALSWSAQGQWWLQSHIRPGLLLQLLA